MQTVSAITQDLTQPAPVYEIPENVTENISQALRGLQYGEITITVRNGSVTQIERVARKRQFKSKPD